MSQIQNLREYIQEICNTEKLVSLADVIAIFDCRQHCIPTLNEIQHAIKGIDSICITRSEDGVFLKLGSSTSEIDSSQISEKDMEKAYSSYRKLLKR